MADCIETLHWVDCWCPDAAQFILVEASSDLRSNTCHDLVRAINNSHFRPKVRLVCRATSLADGELLAIFHRQDIGFLLAIDGQSELRPLAEKGILAVRVDGDSALSPDTAPNALDTRRLLREAHDLGLRSIASQIPTAEGVRDLLALGFDYVSQNDGGFIPSEPSFAWQRKVV